MGLAFRDEAPLEGIIPDMDLQETARTIDNNDAEKIVTGGGLALGIVFIVTTIALYAYYYTTVYDITAFQGFRKRSSATSRSGKASQPASFVYILNALDKAFERWGLESNPACMERIVCESYMPGAAKVNQQVSGKITSILKSSNSESLEWSGNPEAEVRLRNILAAADAGAKTKSCQYYEDSCPQVTSKNLMK